MPKKQENILHSMFIGKESANLNKQKFNDREKYLTCTHCNKPLLDNELVKDSYKLSNQLSYLETQLKIISDILKDKGDYINSERISELLNKNEYLKY